MEKPIFVLFTELLSGSGRESILNGKTNICLIHRTIEWFRMREYSEWKNQYLSYSQNY